MKLVSFRQLWGADVLHIKFMQPRQDVCANCEVMRHTIQGGDAEAILNENVKISFNEDLTVLPKASLSDK